MSKRTLLETAAAATKSGNRWKVVLAVPGQGMSGKYSKEILKEQGPAAIPAGTKAFIGHAKPEDRKATDQFGKYPDGAYYDESLPKDKYPDGALVAELQVFNKYKDEIEELGSDAELSLHVAGDTDDEGNVVAMYPARQNSVDLVAYAGLEGSGLREKLYESLRENGFETTDRTSADAQKKEKMEQEIKDLLIGLKASIDALAGTPSVKTEADVEAEVKTKVEAEVGAKVDEVLDKYEEQVAKIESAELLPSMVESLKAEARKGKDITVLIESAKKTMDEFKTTLSESYSTSHVYVGQGSSAKEENYMVDRWTA